MENIAISTVKSHHVCEILPYVISFRNKLFPTLAANFLPNDLKKFTENYIENEKGIFLQARDKNNAILGVIGMMSFDYRFPNLTIDKEPTVEVARLFVEPEFRRNGLATKLFKELEKKAVMKKIYRLYLHTHPSLPGAYEFWLKQGFELKLFCEESGFPTYHMSKKVKDN